MQNDKRSSKRPGSGRNIAIEQVEGTLKGAPQRLDAERGQGLTVLTRIKRAKVVQSRRERARMEIRYGADHPRVTEADARMRREHGMLVNSRAESSRTQAPRVNRDDSRWTVHGYVRNQDGVPLGNAGVALYPDKDGYQDALIQVKTDSKGYYRIDWPPAGAKSGFENNLESAAFRHSSAGLESAGDSRLRIRRAAAAVKTPVYLGASYQASKQVDGRALYPTPGNIGYRDIELNLDDSSACQLRTRYLGNSHTRELHDLQNEKAGCRIARISPDHRVYFISEKQAQGLGYDYCAYCYGADRSRR